MRILGFLLLFLLSSFAAADPAFDGSLMRQAPVIAAPKAGTVTGSLSAFSKGVQDLATGSLSYTLPLDFRSERGPLLASIAPSYDIHQGLSEWGLGWQMNLSIQRTRLQGHINYRDDQFSTPWGLVVQGSDQAWYSEGLKSRMRVTIEPQAAVAYGPEGEVYYFRQTLLTPHGTYAYYLTEVVTATGRRTLLTYETLKNVVYLKSVRYGGQGQDLPYLIELSYQTLPAAQHWISFKSKVSQVHSQVIERLVHSLELNGRTETLWTYEVKHEWSPLSPLHFLSSLAKVYPSGAREPALRFDYSRFRSEGIRYETTHKLDELAAAGLSADRLSFYDFNHDGLIDIERAEDHQLFLQSDKGFAAHTQFVTSKQNVCLGVASSMNKARQVMRIKGLESEPYVVHNNKQGVLTFCELNGTVKGREEFSFNPDFHRNALLIDLNGDHKPDLFHLTSSGFEIYANRSNAETVSFNLEKSESHKTVPSLSSLWGTDINGDGLVDIAVVGGTTLKVYMGKGDFDFTPTFLTLPIEREDGTAFDPSSFTPTFTDLNQDGLTDVLFSQGKSLLSFINTGRSFKRLQHEAFEMLAIEGEVFTQNIVGSGEQIIFRSGSAGVRFARLHDAATNLLQSIDDGKGSRVNLTYNYQSGAGNRFNLEKVLTTLSIQQSMEGETIGKLSYEAPYYRSQTSQRMAFDRVTLKQGQSEHVAEFDNRDFASVLRSTVERNLAFPTLVNKKKFGYELGFFRGISTLLRKKEFSYFYDESNGQATDPLTTEVLSWSDSLCEDKISKTHNNKTFELSKAYFQAQRFSQHLQCIPQSLVIAQPDGAFSYTSELRYNAQLQLEEFKLSGTKSAQILQAIQYDDFFRPVLITAADGTTQTLAYVDNSDRLHSLTDSMGVQLSQEALNERDLFTEQWTTRGSARYAQYASYDAFDRLGGQWDSLFGSAAEPLSRFEYSWANLPQPGRVSRSTHNLKDSRIPHIELVSGSGAIIGQLAINANGDWIGQGLKELVPEEQISRAFAHKLLSDPTSTSALFKDPIAVTRQAGFGFSHSSWHTVQEGVVLQSKVRLSVQNGSLLAEETINDHRRKLRAFNSNLQKVSETDGEGNRTQFDYDILGRLEKVTLPSGESIATTYDDLGRVSEVRSSVVGSVHTFYNNRGLVERKERRSLTNQTAYQQNFFYDQKARILSMEAQSQGKSSSYTYTYDGQLPDGSILPGQLGHLSSVTNGAYLKTFQYDVKGRITTQSLKVPDAGISIEKNHEIDALNRPISLAVTARDPSQSIAYLHSYDYDNLGRLDKVQLGSSALRLSYNQFNELELIDGSQQIRYEIDGKTNRRLGFQNSGPKPASLKLNFNSYEEVENENYELAGRSLETSFGYDDRGFLLGARGEDSNESFAYSADGLLHDKMGADVQFSIESGPSYEFDDIGRLTKRSSMRLTYGATGDLDKIENENGQFSIVYDERHRPILIYRDEKIYYLNWEGLSYVNGQWIEPVSIQSHLIAWMRNGNFEPKNYDFKGTLIGEQPTSPYGLQNLSDTSVIDFAGHPYLPELGLVAMGVRFYDPRLSQFTTPDLYFLEHPLKCIESPVECNLYSYARNSPLTFTDPTGKAAIIIGDENFKNYVDKITNYHLEKNPNGAWSYFAQSKDQNINIVEIKNPKAENHYDPVSNNVYLVQNKGMIYQGKVISPATIAEHEAGHAYEKAMHPIRYTLEKLLPAFDRDPQYNLSAYPNQHEKRIIQTFEHDAANRAGEPLRESHFAVDVFVKDPFSHVRTMGQFGPEIPPRKK